MNKAVCFTGHRSNKVGGYNEDNPTAYYVKAKLTETINQAMKDGYRRFIFGGALGVDTWAGEIVADIRDNIYPNESILLELYSPFEGQEGNWPDESKLRYYNLMARCDSIIEISEPGYAVWKMQKRNEAMVNNSHLVIGVWDGTKGGTANCIAYAEKKNKPIIMINPKEYQT